MADSPGNFAFDQPEPAPTTGPAASPTGNTPLPPDKLAEAAPSLPSLLSLFEQATPPRSPVPPPAPAAPPAAGFTAPPPSPPPTAPLATDLAARQRAEQLVAQLRQQAAGPPTPASAPPTTAAALAGAVPPAPPPPRPPATSPGFERVAAAPLPARRGSRNGLLVGALVVALAVLAGLSVIAFRQSTRPVPAAPPTLANTAQAAAPLPAEPPAPVIVRETVRVVVPAPAAPPAAVAADSVQPAATDAAPLAPATTPPATEAAPDSEPVPAAPEAGDDEATTQVRQTLAAYYADLYEPPLHAADYFAPLVERLYIQRNLTPDQIDAELARSFFPDNRHAAYQVEPGTLRVSEPAADSSRTATYVEAVRLFRVSRGQHQRLRTQVRARFNADGKIVYLRQEKLLSNEFEL